jgi:hypothetical protein
MQTYLIHACDYCVLTRLPSTLQGVSHRRTPLDVPIRRTHLTEANNKIKDDARRCLVLSSPQVWQGKSSVVSGLSVFLALGVEPFSDRQSAMVSYLTHQRIIS